MKIQAMIVSLMLLILTGCNNTVQGFGQDMKDNGQKVENSAK